MSSGCKGVYVTRSVYYTVPLLYECIDALTESLGKYKDETNVTSTWMQTKKIELMQKSAISYLVRMYTYMIRIQSCWCYGRSDATDFDTQKEITDRIQSTDMSVVVVHVHFVYILFFSHEFDKYIYVCWDYK